MLVIILEAVGIPSAGIALILGVDRLLDMSRTVLNVTGDLSASVVIARSEGLGTAVALDDPPEPVAAPAKGEIAVGWL